MAKPPYLEMAIIKILGPANPENPADDPLREFFKDAENTSLILGAATGFRFRNPRSKLYVRPEDRSEQAFLYMLTIRRTIQALDEEKRLKEEQSAKADSKEAAQN